MATKQFSISVSQGKYFAVCEGKKFQIGAETVYKGNHGLYNYNVQDGPVYKSEDYSNKYGHWAWMLFPTAAAESKGSFHCLNTYDRAAFTFTFMLFAAHVPNGDFVRFLRKLLQLADAKEYFPFLELRDGRVWYVRSNSASQLESDVSTVELMKYLNSDSKNIDDQELITAARFVHWAQNSHAHRELQVETAVNLFKGNLRDHVTRFNLDGAPDYLCHIICDIFHQGRAKYSLVQNILIGSNSRESAYNALLNIGSGVYDERVKTLRITHKQLRRDGIFEKTYDLKTGEFK